MNHIRVTELIKQDRNEEATKLAMDLLDVNKDDHIALFQLGTILLKESRRGIAYNLFSRALKLCDDNPDIWINFARSHPDVPEEWGKTEWCLKKAVKICKAQKRPASSAYANLAMLHYLQGNIVLAQAEVDKSMEEDPNNRNALVTQGFIYLAKGEWSHAWHLYDLMLKTGKRESFSYGDEPEWDGSKGKRIIISGEQGIGDEIMYSSCFQDAINDCKEVVIECMPRLKNLFQRSFPDAKVYGTRWDKEVFWDEDHKPEAHIAMASLPKFYRNSDGDFPGTPYLKVDYEMANAVNGIFINGQKKPKIGIAWTGGSERTRGYLRTRTLEELTPILRQDAIFVSLEYNDRSEEIEEYYKKRGIRIESYPWLTGVGLDYDLTAALVSQLDLVISVPTTVTQMAGALGVPCWVMVPKYTGWIFARNSYPWASSVITFKNPTMKDMASNLSDVIEIFNQQEIRAVG